MKLVIPGGSGQIGTMLARAYHTAGHDVVVLGRNPAAAPWRTVRWDGETVGPWADELSGADAVINLAGRSVDCRYTDENRSQILDSRVHSTRAVGEAIAAADRPPPVWLQASTATIYAHCFDAPNGETDGRLGGNEPDAPSTWRFSVDVAKAWEQALMEADVPDTRRVAMRSAMVMSPDRGGVFDVLLRLVRFGLGGRAGSGQQYVSWIHDVDFVRAVDWLLTHENIDGPVNLAAPHPLPNAAFMRTLREAWGAPLGLPAAEWMLEVGAFFMRTETELVLKSRRVVPERLTSHGFSFQFPEWSEAARNLCRRWRATNGHPPPLTEHVASRPESSAMRRS